MMGYRDDGSLVSEGQEPGADCGICKHNRRNGGIDCDPDAEDYLEPCDGFEVYRPEDDM